ncbi:TlpA disulfide reductase family protein [Siphonobacter sp. SORGH_AS_1065]|uniref:TlpA disulfide reductase family protein n=1 Tax=Siphonobacter sp. SORGH_AS_1065 TaxID=3041795 RepID=UPI0027818665|nr:TlpA disulfide reductase family protein [Siphonobacter sp. SORGH_AS_1065]MDQ1089174.1 peroxiredoxin [Siphonobacter sp. SORGH_AS_1065]
MKYIAFFLLGFLPHVSLSQSNSKPKSSFVLRGQLANAAGKQIYLRETVFYKTHNRVDSTKADPNGRFTFRGTVKEPSYYVLQTSLNDQALGFYIENKPIYIRGSADSIYTATVTGSPEETIRQQYDLVYKKFDDYPLYLKLEESKSKGDTVSQRDLNKQMKEVESRRNAALFELVQKYPLAAASVNHVGNYYIPGHELPMLKIADSLLSVYESSSIASSQQVKYFRNLWLNAKKSAIGRNASDFVQPDTSGKPISLSTFRGRYVLVDFWASWCQPCREESPFLVKAYQDFSKKNFTILSVSLDRDKSKWMKAIAKDQLNWSHVSDLKFWDNEAAKQYAVTAIPFNVLVDPKGTIIAVNLRGDDLHSFLQANLR